MIGCLRMLTTILYRILMGWRNLKGVSYLTYSGTLDDRFYLPTSEAKAFFAPDDSHLLHDPFIQNISNDWRVYVLFLLIILLNILILALVGNVLHKEKVLGGSFAISVALILILFNLFTRWDWTKTSASIKPIFLYLGTFFSKIGLNLYGWMPLFIITGWLAWLALMGFSIVRKLPLLGLLLLSSPIQYVLINWYISIVKTDHILIPTIMTWSLLVSVFVVPIAWLLRSAGYIWRRQWLPALAALLILVMFSMLFLA